MATLYTRRDENITKTWLLMALFLGLVIGIGYLISYYYQNPGILTFAIVFAVVMNITGLWFSDRIALSIARAQPAPEDQYPELHRIVENLAKAAGLPKPRIYIIPDQAPNAFATGRNAKHAAIAVTIGLLNIMDRNELEGVLAHELAHIGNRDILLQGMVAVLVGFVAILADMFTRSLIFGGGRRDDNRSGGIMAVITIVFIVLSPIIATLIQLAISRRREFLADATGALITRYPEGLASALRKLEGYSRPMEHASNATAHMYISSPFGARSLAGMQKLFRTHPPIEARVQALLNMK